MAKQQYDRETELKAFDDTKSGVKGLLDSGITKIPQIFVHKNLHLHETPPSSNFTLPTIDFKHLEVDETIRSKVIDQVRDACENWGFFQVVNHGVPETVMSEMIDGVRKFHEQDVEMKKPFYSRDYKKRFVYNSNFDLFKGPAANFCTSFCIMSPESPLPEEMPEVCS